MVKEIDGGLDSLQSLVGGWIEIAYLGSLTTTRDIVAVVDEEGLLKQKKPNLNTVAYLGPDLLVGDVVLCRTDRAGELVGLTDTDLKVLNELT